MRALSIRNLTKTYSNGVQALKGIDFDVDAGDFYALLGPNGAGKTTAIGIITSLVNKTAGTVEIFGHDIDRELEAAKACIGLVPQELPTETFETPWNTCRFSRGLFGKPENPVHVEHVLRTLSLWDRRDEKIMMLSGGMKRRVLIAKALAHEPDILFLDEPTAGVDVELRQDLWNVVGSLRESGVTVILTTHYIEEAEQLADRIGVINHGEVIIVQEKDRLMRELGKKELILQLSDPVTSLPGELARWKLELGADGNELTYHYDTRKDHTGITSLLAALGEANIHFNDLHTKQSSLQEIFVGLVRKEP